MQENLQDWGFGPRWAERLAALGRPEWRAARVVAEHRERFSVVEEAGERAARPAGRLRRDSERGATWPAVGDWVAVSGDERDETLAIQAVLERDGAFTRAAAGTTSAAQVVAANVDVALLVQALDRPPSPRRVERSLALAWHAAAAPIVVLSKADLCPDPAPACAELSAIAVGAPLLVLSAVTGAGMDALVARLARGRTFVLVGLSGAGKSTLVNALAGSAVLPTGAVREADRRGRHTTTHRQMVRLPCGALAIDTPGVREIGLVDAADGLEEAFADVESLAAHCRFADCAHDTEPDCAVRAAVEAGTLDAARLVSFRRLLREEAYEARRRDAAAQAAEERRWRSLHRALRDHPKYRR